MSRFKARDTRIQKSRVRERSAYHRLVTWLLKRLHQGSEKRQATTGLLGAAISGQLTTRLVAKTQHLKRRQKEERFGQRFPQQGAERVQMPNVVALVLKRRSKLLGAEALEEPLTDGNAGNEDAVDEGEMLGGVDHRYPTV